MEIRTDHVHLSAEFETGVRLIEGVGLVEARLGPVGCSCAFDADGRSHLLAKTRPDSVLQENDRPQVTQIWRGASPSDRVVFTWIIRPAADGDGLLFQATVANERSEPLNLERVTLLDVNAEQNGKFTLGFSAAEWSIFRHGWQSWSASRPYRLIERDPRPLFRFLREMEENVANPSPNRYGVFTSEQAILVRNTSSGQSLLLGFLTGARAFGDIRLEIDPKSRLVRTLCATCRYDGMLVAPRQTVETETLWLRFAGKGKDSLGEWAKRSGREMQARVPAEKPVGWCSWYYYYTKISEATLLDNLRVLAPLREELGLHFFQLDDGYQAAIGDWLKLNEKFPSGLPALVQQINEAGFVAGIWTAPFLVHPHSELARTHPDWLLRDAKGRPLRGGYNPLWDKWRNILTLDPTHPEVLAWLRDLFSTLYGMGWRFFKIDFLYAAAQPAAYHDPSHSRASALRAGLQAIRDAIGPDSFLLGCGCPLGPAVGLVDAMRIGCDVTPRWSNPMRWAFRDHHCLSTRHSLRNTIQRSFLQRAWWINDPDCVLVRQNKNKMNIHEVRTLASIDALSGGMLLISDDMTQLAPDRLDTLRKALAIRTETMQVLDADVGEFPSRLLARADDGYYLLVVNWLDQEENPPIFDLKEVMQMSDLARVSDLREIWSNQSLHQHDGLVNLGAIPAHGCRLVHIRLRQG